MQADTFIHGRGNFWARGYGLFGLCCCALVALCFLAGQIALMERNLALAVDIDIDPPAFALGRLVMLPCLKASTGRNNLDTASTFFEISGLAPINGCTLSAPESIDIAKPSVTLKQVSDNPTIIAVQVKERDAG